MNIPRIVITGTNSGCGKTTVSTGIMDALVKRGLKVQPFKVGPDYIDPMFHTFITGNFSRNLDSWMLDERTVSYLFSKNSSGADIAVVEGVMGMYDGYGGYSEGGSTAHVSKIINSPVVLVVNGEGMSLSIVPIIKGFMDFDRNVNIRGVIINNINSEGHFQLLKKIIEEHLSIAVIGYLKTMSEYSLPSRHLGLVPGEEVGDLRERVDILSRQIEKTLDMELLIKLAGEETFCKSALPHEERCETGIEWEGRPVAVQTGSKARIAVAWDKAFNFYYRDNLDLLELLGAELVYFSPIGDDKLPEDIDGLYIGGGYPEVWGGDLEKNTSMRESIRRNIMKGLPAYAECGGLMYLSREIKNRDGTRYEMVGIIPGVSEMTSSLQRFGYVEIDIAEDNAIAEAGWAIRGHEFHYSTTTVASDIPTCCHITKNRRDSSARSWKCGFKLYNLLAGYPHMHFWSNPEFAKRFVDRCKQYRDTKKQKLYRK